MDNDSNPANNRNSKRVYNITSPIPGRKNLKEMIQIFGVINSEGTHTDTSKTLRGAKNYATRNGYNKVSKRTGYNARIISVKLSNNKWVNE